MEDLSYNDVAENRLCLSNAPVVHIIIPHDTLWCIYTILHIRAKDLVLHCWWFCREILFELYMKIWFMQWDGTGIFVRVIHYFELSMFFLKNNSIVLISIVGDGHWIAQHWQKRNNNFLFSIIYTIWNGEHAKDTYFWNEPDLGECGLHIIRIWSLWRFIPEEIVLSQKTQTLTPKPQLHIHNLQGQNYLGRNVLFPSVYIYLKLPATRWEKC